MANVGIEPGGNHALACGIVMGALMKGLAESEMYEVEPIMDDGDHTNALLLTHKITKNRYVIQTVPQDKL